LPTHPFSKIPTRNLVWMFVICAVTFFILTAILLDWDQQIRHRSAPFGIFSFEMAWSVEGLTRVVGPWTDEVRAITLRITLFDYIYLMSYSTSLVLLCLFLSRWARRRHFLGWQRFWEQVAWAPWLAALFDVIENTVSIPLILTKPTSPWPQIMTTCAAIKFSIVGLVFGLVWFCVVYFLVAPRRAP
jgi:hypothetical protein